MTAIDISELSDNKHVRTVTVDIERLTDAIIVAVEEFFDDDLSSGDHEGLSEEVYSVIDAIFKVAAEQPYEAVMQIVREEWHRAVKEFELAPGTPTEAVTSRILTRVVDLKANGVNEPSPDEQGWQRVGAGTPLNCWLETKCDGEKGTNECQCRIMSIGDEPEWVERRGGRTTVTHSTFAPPTHWRWPAP